MRVKSEELIDIGLSASLRSFLFVSQSVSLSLSVCDVFLLPMPLFRLPAHLPFCV